MEPTMRRATAADFPQILGLLTASHLPHAGLQGPENFVVLRRGDEVLGCAAIERYASVGLLRSVAVLAAERDKGLGRKMVDEILEQACRDGFSELVLLTTTAAKFFAGLGFERIERHQAPLAVQSSVEFQGACPDSATVMLRKL